MCRFDCILAADRIWALPFTVFFRNAKKKLINDITTGFVSVADLLWILQPPWHGLGNSMKQCDLINYCNNVQGIRHRVVIKDPR
jgi:hypothetical protein